MGAKKCMKDARDPLTVQNPEIREVKKMDKNRAEAGRGLVGWVTEKLKEVEGVYGR